MNTDESTNWYLALSDPERLVFLAHLAHDLTLHGRYFGHFVTGEQQTRAFMGLNDLNHQISAHIAGIALAHERYPDDVLWKILEEKAAAYGIANHLKSSIERARLHRTK